MDFALVVTLILATWTQVGDAAAAGRKLPPGLTPCSRNDPKLNECALKNANIAIPYIAKGNPAYGMIPQDPLLVPEFRIDDTGTSRQVQLDLWAKDVSITGLKHARIKSMNLNLTSGFATWKGFVPRVSFVGKYNVSGHVLILPIVGSGDLNITLDNVDWTYSFNIVKAGKKDGREYVRPENHLKTFTTTRCYILMDNLFNGEKALNDQMNAFLNENWREMVKDLGPPIVAVLSAATNQVIETIMKQVPYDELFPDTPVPST